jgi:hypothetical protein
MTAAIKPATMPSHLLLKVQRSCHHCHQSMSDRIALLVVNADRFVVYAHTNTFFIINGTQSAHALPQTYVSPYLNGPGTSDTGTVTYSNYPPLTLSFLTNSAPELAPLPNYTLVAGQPLQFTNYFTDANIPPLTLV